MCEYCGCQDIPAIAELTREHDLVRDAARAAEQAAAADDHPAAVAAARRLAQLLEPHSRIEELGLFPAMAAEFGEHTDRLVGEHRDLERTLADITVGGADDGWQHRLTAAVHQLFEHILREQDGLFPATLSVLTAEQWDALDDVRRAVTGDGASLSDRPDTRAGLRLPSPS